MKCNACQYEIDLSRGVPAFCPSCGIKLSVDENTVIEVLICEALKQQDFAKRREMLLAALEKHPNSLEIQKQLLYIGRMGEKGGKPDFYRIPFWPLSALERPKEFPKRERAKMLGTLLSNPELERVKTLCPDQEAFMDEYLEKMAEGYAEMFIKSATSNNSIFIFRRSKAGRMDKYAQSLKLMITNLRKTADVPEDFKPRLEAALYAGFAKVFGQESANEVKQALANE